MIKKMVKRSIIFLLLYLLVFWIGFRAGEIRRQAINNKLKATITLRKPMRTFFVVERRYVGEGHYFMYLDKVIEDNTIIQYFLNKRMRHFLKDRNMRIYSSRGVRIY